MSAPSPVRSRAALLAFLFHAPGLYLLTPYRLSAAQGRTNAVALLLTFAVMGIGAMQQAWGFVLVAWLIGHFGWSAYLARTVWRGRCAQAVAKPPT